jgi:hypothetical protein
MLDLIYIAKLDYLAGLRRSLDDAVRRSDRFSPVGDRQEIADVRPPKARTQGFFQG